MLDVNSKEYRKAALSLNFELESLFKKNLKYFKSKDINIFNAFNDYKPKELSIRLDAKGYLNLYNVITGKSVYPDNPTDYAERQVDNFLKNRSRFNVNIDIYPFEYDDFIYTKVLTKLNSKYSSLNSGVVPAQQRTSVPILFMFGGGMFLQLQSLLNKLDVKRLVVFEPNNDSFYASLHIIDWSEIYRYFDRDGYNFHLMILRNGATDTEKIASYLATIGFHHFPRFETYFHYSNPVLKKGLDDIRESLQVTFSSTGYFDDEKIGLSHSIQNLKGGYPYCFRDLNNRGSSIDVPVFLVGNGPSLDFQAEFLKKHQNKAIIISCGTAFGTLLKKGIKSDIHLEQERLDVVRHNLENSSTPEDRRGVVLFALNPCHPSVLGLFDSACIVNKSIDLGTDFLAEITKTKIYSASRSNPIVANFGLSIAISLGFKKVYLFGVDCGMINEDDHHSVDSSLHYKAGEQNRVRKEKIFGSGKFEVIGNMRDSVITTPTMNFSRLQLELLLKEHPINCINSCDGAKIKGALTVNVNEIVINQSNIDKSSIVKELIVKNFKKFNLSIDSISAEIIKFQLKVEGVCLKIIDAYNVATLDNSLMLDRLDYIDNLLADCRHKDDMIYSLLSGSCRDLSFKLSTAMHNLNEESYIEFKTLFIDEVTDFYKGVIKICKEGIYNYH
jgi:hypothetical protein